MNMISLVRATEQETAHFVNRRPWTVNCSLLLALQPRPPHKFLWKKASERVRIPYLWGVPGVRKLVESRVLWTWCAKWEVIFF